jgi:hypothetical protein
MRFIGALAAVFVLLALTGPTLLAAGGGVESCAMCAERCCCKPPDGSAMSGGCRWSRPCAAGERKDIAPPVSGDPAVLAAVMTGIAAAPEVGGVSRLAPARISHRNASPPVPPPRA